MDLTVRSLQRDIDIMKDVLGRANAYLAENREIFNKLPHLWPLPDGGYITSEYGWREHPIRKRRTEFHRGLDIANYPGSPIVATADGTVLSASYDPSFGYYVRVMHAYGFVTCYGHCQRLKARAGQSVRKGQVIAYVGRTGMTTGYHLHYEIRLGFESIDPMPYLMKMK
jgi:murein DD-endopeptidase MepM/ murein hydrolase activator NlpD